MARGALSVLCSQLRYGEGIPVARSSWFGLVRDATQKFLPRRRVHAGKIEASMGLYLAPRIVRTRALARGMSRPDPYSSRDPGTGGGVEVAYFWEELTPNWAYGDARRARATIGRELTDAFQERASEFVEAFTAQLGGPPARRAGSPRPRP